MPNEPIVTVVADYQNLCGECPLWDPEEGVLYWVDNSAPKIYTYTPADGRHRVFHEGLTIGGLRRNRAGGFVIGTAGGIWLWPGTGAPQLICDSVDGARCAINDCAADSAGRFLAGSVFYNPNGEYERGKLFRVDTHGAAEIIDEGFGIANGLGFTADGTRLYFADSAERIIYAYDYRPEDGRISGRRVFVKVPSTEGLPDGLCVDKEGYVWSAQWFGSCIVRYDPDGKIERRIAIPAKQTSSLAFGGADLTDLFITSAGHSEPMPIMPPGYDPDSGTIGGALYHLNTGIEGKPEFRADITLTR